MALTLTQKTQVRLYLGYPDLYRYKNTRLESVLDNNLSAEAEAVVVQLLADITSIDAKVFGFGLSSSGVKRVDEIEFFQGRTLTDMRAIGKERVSRLSVILGVPVNKNPFETGGYPGDDFFGGGGSTSGGGMFPLG